MGRILLLFVTFLVLGICFSIFMQGYWLLAIRQARRKGLYPEEGKATMFDVRRLILEGENELAIRVYCQIFGTNRKEARKAVEELKRSLSE